MSLFCDPSREVLRLMTKDQKFDLEVHRFVGTANDQAEHTAQQEVDEGVDQGPNLHEMEARCYEGAGSPD